MSKSVSDGLQEALRGGGVVEVTDEIFSLVLEKWISGRGRELAALLSEVREFRYRFGTREWADENFNTHYACKHGCRYCYAWNEAYRRRRDYWEDWGEEMTRRPDWDKGWRFRGEGYTIMYPTTHDILPEIRGDAFLAIGKMLDAGINVLVVTKPHLEVIEGLTERFRGRRSGSPRLTLRLTIGTDDDRELSFWEPGAPPFAERLECLKLAHREGFRTSVSMEPFFPAAGCRGDPGAPEFAGVVERLLPYVRGTLWIGKMNHLPGGTQRGEPLTERQRSKVESLERFYRWDNISGLLECFHSDPRVRWKESIKRDLIGRLAPRRL
jgi:hypothetical protein